MAENITVYYFIMYKWSRYVQGSQYTEDRWVFGEELTTTHPVQWLIDIRNKYSITIEHGKRIQWKYTLIGWEEVSKEIYDTYKGEVG